MPRTNLRRAALLIALAPLALPLGGCSGADDPKIAQAPIFKAPENPAPPKIPNRKTPYGSNPQYKKMMEKMQQSQR